MRCQTPLDNELATDALPSDGDVERKWELKCKIWKTGDAVTINRKSSTRTWKLIQSRKELRSRGLSAQEDRAKYSELSTKIQSHCRCDKNNFIGRICKEIEDHALRMQTSDLFKNVKLLTKQFKPKTGIIEDKNGTTLHEISAITKRWQQYCAELYSDPQNVTWPDPPITWNKIAHEPCILRSEVTAALAALKVKKAFFL